MKELLPLSLFLRHHPNWYELPSFLFSVGVLWFKGHSFNILWFRLQFKRLFFFFGGIGDFCWKIFSQTESWKFLQRLFTSISGHFFNPIVFLPKWISHPDVSLRDQYSICIEKGFMSLGHVRIFSHHFKQ